jgi:transposase
MLTRLDVVGIIDDVVGARRSDAGGSVGTYICLATLNRVVAPCSKLAFADWWSTTAADRWIPMPKAALDHRRFWTAMDSIDAHMLVEIERRIGAAMVTEFGLDQSGLVLDMTNFATYIDTANDRAPIAQRGRAKQKRTDLRLVGLGLIVTRDGGIPLCSHAYAGDRPDVTQFADMVTELVARWGTLATDTNDITLVYDAGQDSITNQTHIDHRASSTGRCNGPAMMAGSPRIPDRLRL